LSFVCEENFGSGSFTDKMRSDLRGVIAVVWVFSFFADISFSM